MRNLIVRSLGSLGLAAALSLPVTGVINQVATESAVAQARKNRVVLSVSPRQSRYRRGTSLRIRARVIGSNGQRVAGTPILVQETSYNSRRRRTVNRTLVRGVTNHRGVFVYNYTVPTNPNKDKVTLSFVNPAGNGTGGAKAFVIPIGR